MRRFMPVGASLALFLGACGFETIESSYNPRLIHAIGAGSSALAEGLGQMQKLTQARGSFLASATQRPQALLLKGERAKLRPRDISLLSETLQSAPAYVVSSRAIFRRLKSRVLADRVTSASWRGLSPGARRFSLAWNDDLSVTARLLDVVRDQASVSAPAVKEFRELLTSAQRDPTQKFEQVRHRVVTKAISRVDAFEETKKQITAQIDRTSKSLSSLIASDLTARIIVRQVNKQYPTGILAEYK